MRLILFLLMGAVLNAFTIYVDKSYEKPLPKNIHVKYFENIRDINLSEGFALIKKDDFPFVLKNHLKVIFPIGVSKTYIITKNLDLRLVKSVANINLPAKIALDRIANYKEVNVTFEDFLKGKADAYVLNRPLKKKGFVSFDISKLGIFFNKYYLIGTNRVKIGKNDYIKLKKTFDVDYRPFFSSVFHTLIFLNKKLDYEVMYDDAYLNLSKTNYVKVAITPNWPPFDIYENGELSGIGVDFFKLIAKKASLDYKIIIVDYWPDVLDMIKTKKVDITPNTSETPERKKYALFSKPYYSFSLGVVCNINSKIKSFREVKKIAVGKDYTAEKLMKKHYPDITYIETKNVYEALKMAAKNKDICAVDMLPTILWYIQKHSMYNLNLIYQTPFKFNLQVMVRKDRPDILEKINNAIDDITPQEKREIINRYIGGILKEKKNNYNFVFVLLAFLVLIVSAAIVLRYRKSARTDELTGILNRRGFIKEAKNISVESSLLFFDIDHFKKVNDTYGHDFGDYVLKELARLISENIRSADVFARWGGEEFVLILRGTPYEKALRVAEKLRLIIANYNFKGVKVTISIGVAPFKGDLKEAVKKTDEALYEAKRSGRNQVKGKK